jgi:hypothetical protein
MTWTEKIFAYCERASDPGFWAEPFNAISNVAFLLVGIVGAAQLARQPRPSGRIAEWGLALLVLLIGTGSFLFHTYATRWASVADTAPIGIFMICYLAYALRRFLLLNVFAVIVFVAVFILALRFASAIPCDPALLPVTIAAGRPCFNGSLGYVPALGALVLIGGVLLLRRHPAGWSVFLAGGIFAVSLALRTVDFEICTRTLLLGRPRGTHALWHVLNALVLFTLLSAAIRPGSSSVLPEAPSEANRIAHLRRPEHKGGPADVVELVDTQDLKS